MGKKKWLKKKFVFFFSFSLLQLTQTHVNENVSIFILASLSAIAKCLRERANLADFITFQLEMAGCGNATLGIPRAAPPHCLHT